MIKREPFWNLYSCGIIGLFCLFQIFQWPLSPKFLDAYYHLSVMRGFAEAGGVVLVDFWEYAPVGRPHLYPPLLHILMLVFFKMGFEAVNVARLVECLLWPVLSIVLWHVIRKTATARLAFFCVLVYTSGFGVYLSSATYPAFTMALIFGLIAYGLLEKGNIAGGTAATALMFYTHGGAGWFLITSFIIYAVLKKERKRPVFLVAAGGFLLALPWIIHQWHWRGWFKSALVKDQHVFTIDPAIYILALMGLVLSFKRKTNFFYIALFTGTMLFAASYPFRYLGGSGIIAVALLAAVSLDHFYEKISKTRFSAFFLLFVAAFFYLAAPVAELDLKNKKWDLSWFDRSISHYLWPSQIKSRSPKEFSVHFPQEYEKIAQIVKDHSKPGDILWSDFTYGAGALAGLTALRTSSAMLAEVKPYYNFDPARSANIHVWFKTPEGRVSKKALEAAETYHLKKVGETGMTLIYQNPAAHSLPYTVPRPIFPTGFAMILVLSLTGWVLFEFIKC